jgi:hypothetical protein
MGSRHLFPFVPLVALGLAEAVGTLNRESFRRLALFLKVVFLFAGFAHSRYGGPAEPVEGHSGGGACRLLAREDLPCAQRCTGKRFKELLVGNPLPPLGAARCVAVVKGAR